METPAPGVSSPFSKEKSTKAKRREVFGLKTVGLLAPCQMTGCRTLPSTWRWSLRGSWACCPLVRASVHLVVRKMYLDAQFEKQALLISSLGESADGPPLSGKMAPHNTSKHLIYNIT